MSDSRELDIPRPPDPPEEELHCPKCGEPATGPYALLGHIYTNHWIIDEHKMPEGWSR